MSLRGGFAAVAIRSPSQRPLRKLEEVEDMDDHVALFVMTRINLHEFYERRQSLWPFLQHL